MPREQYSPRTLAKRLVSLISGFFFELGFIVFVILLVLSVTFIITFLLLLVG